jgi:hypothetical protein
MGLIDLIPGKGEIDLKPPILGFGRYSSIPVPNSRSGGFIPFEIKEPFNFQ